MTTAVRETRGAQSWTSLPPMGVIVVVVGWITTVLVLDAASSRWEQRVLGVATWCLLLFVVSRESPVVRMQTAVVVVFASIVEFTFSPLLGVYHYRFDNVPAYVPPGHGLVYLTAIAISRTNLVRTSLVRCTVLTLVCLGGYAASGVLLAPRPDLLGALWFLCLAGFLRWGPSPGLYVGAAVVVTYLELVGTTLGTWTWQHHDPTGLVSIGNPPSGAAGGYGWFDLVAVAVAPALLARAQRVTRASRRRRSAVRESRDADDRR